MTNIPIILLVLIGSPALLFNIGRFVYRTWFRPDVRRWFGEEIGMRGNHEARRRRRTFESRCMYATLFFAVSIAPGIFREITSNSFPALAQIGLLTQVAFIAVGGLLLGAL